MNSWTYKDKAETHFNLQQGFPPLPVTAPLKQSDVFEHIYPPFVFLCREHKKSALGCIVHMGHAL